LIGLRPRKSRADRGADDDWPPTEERNRPSNALTK